VRLWWPVAALLVVAAVAWLWPRSDAPAVVVPAAEVAAARAELDGLAVRGRAPRTGYEREQFGDGWADLDGDGCSTRDDVLARDLTALERDGCRVLAGVLRDPYGGTEIAFSRDRAEEVQIDHVVALADAWQKGAQQWTAAQRAAFANDPVNLLAVDGALNQAKGAGDAATWLPPARSYRCPYVIRQIAVKAKWGLWVTRAERDALARELGRCRTVPG
jgi:hypothetical protein